MKGDAVRTERTLDFVDKTQYVVALGCFDGLHKGHTTLIRRAKEIAQSSGRALAVFSFEEPPKNLFLSTPVPILTQFDEKKRIIRALGADLFVCVKFDADIAKLDAESFFSEILCRRLNASAIVCGFNYRFGKGGRGDTELLASLCKEREIGLFALPPVVLDGISVSSSEIRNLLSLGDVKGAQKLLGRKYSLRATVVDGQHLGRTLGFPTINQLWQNGTSPLKNGVYATQTRIGNTVKRSITNVGVRPTVDGHTLCAETHIFDFSGDLYGKQVRVEFLDFIREEKKFSSIDELKAQVLEDIKNAKAAK